ncbi:hypothetical protein N7524_004567 [Penicillium chrysogenum]|nr:hypothetical protein N7524_004567 [Penicillium chrysogenum]
MALFKPLPPPDKPSSVFSPYYPAPGHRPSHKQLRIFQGFKPRLYTFAVAPYVPHPNIAQSRGKEAASLENVGTINISTTAIRRIDDSTPAITVVIRYPDTQNLYRLIGPECTETRDIIIAFYRDRDNTFGFANLT